jgi:hypothetical protein
MMEETPRGGRHFYYLGKNNCDGSKLHDVGVELLGLGQIVVVYHKWLNDNLPTSMISVEAVFAELARALGKKGCAAAWKAATATGIAASD